MTGAGPLDLLIVGGGINGAGIARDAAGRGLAVSLVEMGDLANATSSASSKLVHGGLRYLEHYEFRLVRESLAEREVLLNIAPHIIWPLTFVLPHDPSMRSRWLIRAGLMLYDTLARRNRLAASRAIDLATHAAGTPLNSSFRHGFTYSDCWVDDSRLVVLNAMDARERGATIRTRCRMTAVRHDADLWHATIQPEQGRPYTISARVLVNAAGPWAGDVWRMASGSNGPSRLRLIKGSHIVVPRLYEGDWAYLVQQPDQRVVFIIPYEGQFTLIGTTDVAFEGDAGSVAISEDEVRYLCAAASRVLAHPVDAGRIVWSYAGVRALYDDENADPQAITRDYVLQLDHGAGRPALLSVFGGKITTYRRLAEHALERLSVVLSVGRAWTATQPLPGGDIAEADPGHLVRTMCEERPWLPQDLADRWARSYGTRAARILGDARSLADLGEDLGCGLTAREVAYLIDQEWARSPSDILWRRSKLGLHGGAALADRLGRFLASGTGSGGPR